MNTLDKLLEILCGALLGLLSGALGLLACVMLTLLCGCSTPQPVVVERVVVKTDTLYKARTSADTFRLHDSVYVEHYTRGDTVYRLKSVWRWRDRISVKTDTIYKAMLQTDTTRLPIPAQAIDVGAHADARRAVNYRRGGAYCSVAVVVADTSPTMMLRRAYQNILALHFAVSNILRIFAV